MCFYVGPKPVAVLFGDLSVENVSVLLASDEGGEKVIRFKRWFWAIVEKMNNMERQDLVRK